tara:strand:+ start:363 stop:770 length:408 start_codon:yes stop_codon:yes gene_type:complete
MVEPHAEFGLNPTRKACFACGDTTDEVVLAGNELNFIAPSAYPFPPSSEHFHLCSLCDAIIGGEEGIVITRMRILDDKSMMFTGLNLGVKREAVIKMFPEEKMFEEMDIIFFSEDEWKEWEEKGLLPNENEASTF